MKITECPDADAPVTAIAVEPFLKNVGVFPPVGVAIALLKISVIVLVLVPEVGSVKEAERIAGVLVRLVDVLLVIA